LINVDYEESALLFLVVENEKLVVELLVVRDM
jgi:hypothetical protein